MDAGDRAVRVGGREGGLDLARHQLGRRMTDEVADVRGRVRGRIEEFVGADACPRIAGHVADRVPAALAAGELDRGDLADQLLHLVQRDVMDLDVLPGRDVALVQRRVSLDHVREGVHLIGRDPAEGELHADHLHPWLALTVDALLEPEADELVLGRLPVEELVGFGVEVVELVGQDRNHVARNVSVDLGVLS